ncbi:MULTISPECIES: PilZ domain-containing protein [unclassified Undibacterium]|uniref:PilZ domain-containing protein n=1 Tax=unclassified Undibacterium TaxID=2630295 RepID=UPI002AC9DA74|nr:MULTISPECIES: PilZ domain-containing protein [unclassified Undibacterium]MEB0139516.1 PilZ domain-containing protein [Undibacterium sp. CCC2.1]MEB0172375.1 PilZ domain-containing protein [Undibacterium sp. CCC1.1]MEB0175702.1 PilZ domain-containing protein [Undibacterium sp. CCC3.4]MEB0214490.1 PilZ domain-containing protein [Undibacterium sp. 5I2]WPX42885.1 PilZ domain-containing protein [Undibacterium sp. CCC3.4]
MSDLSSDSAIPAVPNRPSVLSLAIKEKAALFAAYMPFLKNGGIFVPTNRNYRLGEEIYLILTLLDDPAKYPVAGKVAWITPAGAGNNKSQGIGVHFPEDESGTRIRLRVEEALGSALRSSRATHTI